jgi:hypothetical protein
VRSAGSRSAEVEEPKERASDPEPGRRADAPSFVPDERSGSDGDRRDRGGNGPVVLSEYGPDWSRFPTEKQFVSHVTLAPHKPTNAGKPVKKKKRNSASTRVAAADGGFIAAP